MLGFLLKCGSDDAPGKAIADCWTYFAANHVEMQAAEPYVRLMGDLGEQVVLRMVEGLSEQRFVWHVARMMKQQPQLIAGGE
jgi:hypothetical protein